MNKQSFLNNLHKKKFLNKTAVGQVYLANVNLKQDFTLNKIKTQRDIDDFLYNLAYLDNEGFIIFPYVNINFDKILFKYEVIVFDAGLKIKHLIRTVNDSNEFNKKYSNYSKMILPSGNIKHLKLEIDEKIRFRRVKHI
ncbi:MAG: hypothetical protein ACRC42_02820 [Mycoplasma sp.]